MVDYVNVRGVCKQFGVLPHVLKGLSDHVVLHGSIDFKAAKRQLPASPPRTLYKWVEGSSLQDYADSWRAWNSYTDTPGFAQRLHAVIDTWGDNTEGLA